MGIVKFLSIIALCAVVVCTLPGCKAKRLREEADTVAQQIEDAKVKQQEVQTVLGAVATGELAESEAVQAVREALPDSAKPAFDSAVSSGQDIAAAASKWLTASIRLTDSLQTEWGKLQAKAQAAQDDEDMTWQIVLGILGAVTGGSIATPIARRSGVSAGASAAANVFKTANAADSGSWTPAALAAYQSAKNASPSAVWNALDAANPVSNAA